MADFGIKISSPGTNASHTSNPNDLILNMSYPLHKLDVTNQASFQNIFLQFATDPPNPDGINREWQLTTVYKFKHNYAYTPSTWFQLQTNIVNNGVGASNALTYQGRRAIIALNSYAGGTSTAELMAAVDSTYVYIQALKGKFVTDPLNLPPSANIVGTTFKMRIYVFAESIANS